MTLLPVCMSNSMLSGCKDHTNVSDNKHGSCPARMSDGRLFTNYNSRCAMQASVLPPKLNESSATGLDSYETRQYMIRNADAIIQSQRSLASCAARCQPCGKDTMLPEYEIDSCDLLNCRRTQTRTAPGVRGLGLGRDHGIAGSQVERQTPGAFTLYSGGRSLSSRQDGSIVDSPWS